MAIEFEKYDPEKHGEVTSRIGARASTKWGPIAASAKRGPIVVPTPDGREPVQWRMSVDTCLRPYIDRSTERLSVVRLADGSGVVVRVLPR